jgi:hypothetical protein
MLHRGLRVSAGTDATRVSSYNPWVCLSWLVTGRTVAGLRIYPQSNCLDRETALRMWTEKVTWFSNEEGTKGRIAVGQYADLIVPDRDYFSCTEDEIADITAILTVVGGKVVYAVGDFAAFGDAPPPPAMPDWSPVRSYGGYAGWGNPAAATRVTAAYCESGSACRVHGHTHASSSDLPIQDLRSLWGALGCSCWAI